MALASQGVLDRWDPSTFLGMVLRTFDAGLIYVLHLARPSFFSISMPACCPHPCSPA